MDPNPWNRRDADPRFGATRATRLHSWKGCYRRQRVIRATPTWRSPARWTLRKRPTSKASICTANKQRHDSGEARIQFPPDLGDRLQPLPQPVGAKPPDHMAWETLTHGEMGARTLGGFGPLYT